MNRLISCAIRALALFALSTNTHATPESTEPTILQATVIKNNLENSTLTVESLSSGKQQSLKVHPGDALTYKAGTPVRGIINGEYFEKIWPATPENEHRAQALNARLREDTLAREPKVLRATGEPLPLFALYDQNGDLITQDSFKGKNIVLTFIFTGCQKPTMCPATTRRMIQLQKAAKSAGLDNLQLIMISFNPDYDTPGILHQYALDRGLDTVNFSLLAGPKSATQDLMRQFGILTRSAKGTLEHTLTALIIGPEQNIRYRKNGNGWDVQEFIERIQAT